jgi:hypothetical protein
VQQADVPVAGNTSASGALNGSFPAGVYYLQIANSGSSWFLVSIRFSVTSAPNQPDGGPVDAAIPDGEVPVVGEDGGVAPDASVAIDAEQPGDATAVKDAALEADASQAPTPDGASPGLSQPESAGGCGCGSREREPAPLVAAALAMLAILCPRRRVRSDS